ncbi:uncharacterized protein EDB93DRAFT_1188325 [Suillus bovinus]|uniref:uncharacterized protein n=1 Tax=Suillus bovinus TaxID=48563 RepID=UPI001B874488|nr:uncharacterized protein EDB93DRAFT_1188325 [Suillus bovinus]KAG2126245.1 hypothetical protein EDB93DRAFT_1188325 [Suillus bovinus]
MEVFTLFFFFNLLGGTGHGIITSQILLPPLLSLLENRASKASSSSNSIANITGMPQTRTRAKTTASAPSTHDLPSSSPAPVTSSSPTRATPYKRSRGPAAASAEPIKSTQPRVRTPLTIRLPRASLVGHATTLSIAKNTSTSSLTASAPAVGINIGTGAPIPTSSIRTPIPAPAPRVSTPPPTSSTVSQPTSTTSPRPPPSALSPAITAPKPPLVSSACLPAPPIYTFPPPPPPPNHVDDPAAAARASSTMQLPTSVTHNASATALSALPPPLANTSVSTSPRCPTPPPSSHTSHSTSNTLRPVQRTLAMASESQITSRQATQAQYPTPSSAGALPSPTSGVDFESDYAVDAMEVDTEGISAMVNSRNNSTAPKTSDRHREANKKYRQRLKERIKNGEIDELEAERMKERKRINARNSRARRKLAMRNQAAKDNNSMSSVEPGPLLASSIEPSLPPPVDPAPSPGDFLLCLPDTNPPMGSYYSTTFHEILTKTDPNTGSSDGASTTYPQFEHDSHPSFDFKAAMPPAVFPLTKARDFCDACTMTDPAPDLSKESDIPSSLEPIAPALARHPHRQLTTDRLHDFTANPLQLLDKAFLLIVPDPSSTLGKLVLCKVLEYRVSSAGHRFLVQFWGDKKASEMGLDRMMEVLEGGYEIDPPPAGPSAGPQGAGLAGRVFGALRSFTGF